MHIYISIHVYVCMYICIYMYIYVYMLIYILRGILALLVQKLLVQKYKYSQHAFFTNTTVQTQITSKACKHMLI
jgi:hypothetical protein